MNLFEIEPGSKAVVVSVKADNSIGRRLMDMGLIEGTEVTCVGRSPGGDPAAFLIRGSIIAIRKRDCADVLVRR